MASNLNNTTPAAPAGSKNVAFATDGAGNDSASYTTQYRIGSMNKGVGANNDIYFYGALDYAVTFPAAAAKSRVTGKAAATGSTTFTFMKNGSSFATAVVSGSGTTGTFTQASDATFNGTTDILEIDGPATADATFANFSIILSGFLT